MASKKEDIDREAINIVNTEVTNFEDAEVFITDRVAFAMRPLIRTLRKNYWGIFDNPKDPHTGHDKVWVPLTRQVCDTVRKNIDIDTKDFNFRSKHRRGRATTDLVRSAVREMLDRQFFGERLDSTMTQLAIDGTAVWKTIKSKDKDGKTIPKQVNVDILNVYIDPTAPSIQDAYRFTERSLMTKDQMKQMNGWRNVEDATARVGLNPNDPRVDVSKTQTSAKFVEVFELWGKIPKWLKTGEESDKESGEEIDGHIVVSNIRQGHGSPLVHLIEENTTKDKAGNIIKPYEEAWYMKVPGRWYGVGPAEMVMALQKWVNTTVNIRINRNRVAQLGLFKVRTGSGITRQMIQKLPTNGVVKVKNMDDIENFPIEEATQSSYTDEDVAVQWARMVSSATDVVAGEQLPASQTATSAVVQERNAKSAFTLVREGVGVFLQRWVDRHVLPILGEHLKKDKTTITILGDIDNIVRLRDRVANHLVMNEISKKIEETGNIPTREEIVQAIQSTVEKLEDDNDLFIKLVDEIIVKDLDTQVFITNEEFNPAVTADKIITTMQIAPEFRSALLPQLTDILGLQAPRGAQQALAGNQNQVSQQAQVPEGMQGRSEQQINTDASTLTTANQ